MKWLRLLKNELTHSLKYDRFALLLVAMGLILGFFTLLLCDGMIRGITASQRSLSRYRSISVVFSGHDVSEEVLDTLEGEVFGAVNNGFAVHLAKNEKYTVIGWKGSSFTRWHALSAGSKFFTAEQADGEERIAFLNISEFDNKNQAKEIELQGKTYRVTGGDSLFLPLFFSGLPEEDPVLSLIQNSYGAPLVIIPYRCFIQDGFTTDVLRLDMKDALTGRRDELEEKLMARFPDDRVYLGNDIEDDSEVQFWFAFYRVVFISMAVMSILNLVVLLRRIVSSQCENFKIYVFCGANMTHVLFLVLSEWVVWGAFSFFLAGTMIWALLPVLNNWRLPTILSFPRATLVLLGVVAFAFLLTLRTALDVSRQSVRPNGGIQ